MALFAKTEVGGHSVGGGRVQSQARYARHFIRNAALTRNLDALLNSGLPGADEAVHIIAHGDINAFTFVLFMVERFAPIECLAVAVYRIGKQVIQSLMQLVDAGDIKRCVFVINDNVERLKPETFRLLTAESKKRPAVELGMIDNHAKITCIKTAADHFVVEGSGNWSDNARVEQYVLINSKVVYDFHLKWIKRSVRSRWT